MTPDEDRLLEHSIRESPASEPHIFWEVVFPPLAFAVAMYLLARLRYDPLTARAFAGAAMLVVLGWRLWQFDRHGRGVHVIEHRRYVEPEETRREWAPVIRDNGDDGSGRSRWRIGNWYWSAAEWQRLAEALQGGTVTREALEGVHLDNGQRMFPNPTGRYQEYLRTFRRMGWIDTDNVLTPAARAWMAERDLPLPPDNVG